MLKNLDRKRRMCYSEKHKKRKNGYVVHRPGWSVRPAIWIDLSV